MSVSYNSEYDKLNYASTETVWEGVIVDITGASVVIDLKGRMGRLEVPKRMVITQYDMQVGQEVAFLMSYPEVLKEQPNGKYVDSLQTYHERMKQIQAKTEQRNHSSLKGGKNNESEEN